ncbi:MAG: hypothetical protein M1834_004812 [Cirrosporium novae-zelandiae]|nr:MAG: hypothetical protein M1834_004812 [Cirrosporium novae-zelandiae]
MPSEEAPQPAGDNGVNGDFNDGETAYPLPDESETTSSGSAFYFRMVNGRRYHSYGMHNYFFPNDEHAQELQVISHHLWTVELDGKYFLAPVKNPQKILDLGTGTGLWATDVGNDFPLAEVKGIDISPIQLSCAPPNVTFEMDDYNAAWVDTPPRYDFIHARELFGSVPNWPTLYEDIYKSLNPGGWFEHAESQAKIFSIDEASSPALTQWGPLLQEASLRNGMDYDMAHKIKGWMEDTGFIDVVERKVLRPIGGWSDDLKERIIGQLNLLRLDTGVSDMSSWLLSQKMKWNQIQIDVFCAYVRLALHSTRFNSYQWAYVVYGRKPDIGWS